ERSVIGKQVYVGPYATLNAASGFIKVGNGSSIQDHAVILGNPNHLPGPTGVLIGNGVAIGFGATVLGPSVIGSYAAGAKGVSIGANALVDGATIEPGATVS